MPDQMDWLWLAGQVDDVLECQYCLQRAHDIDPTCILVQVQPGFFARLKTLIQRGLKRHIPSRSPAFGARANPES